MFAIFYRVLAKSGSEAKIVATHKGRYYKDNDGRMSLGPGPFVEGLEYATGRKAVVLGKPNPLFFENVMNDCGCRPRTTIMIGDVIYVYFLNPSNQWYLNSYLNCNIISFRTCLMTLSVPLMLA